MSLDDLIPFIIFLGLIVFNILKKFGKKKPEIQDSEPLKKPTSKMAFGLSKLVGTIKAELKKAVSEQEQDKEKQSDTIWSTLSEGKELDNDPGDILKEEVSKPMQPLEVKHEPREQAFVSEKQKTPKTSGIVFGMEKRKCKKVLNLSPSKMREAIVLSEIIAKPIGLRD